MGLDFRANVLWLSKFAANINGHMRTIFYLKTCSTCQRILTNLPDGHNLTLREIKSDPITVEEIEEMVKRAGSYEALFSRRAMKYRSLGLHEKNLSEEDYKHWILKEYTFLKRPVVILNDKIFVGNAKKTIEALHEALANE